MFTLKHAVESVLAKVGLNVFSEAEANTDGLLAEGIVLRHANGQEVGRWGLVQPSVTQACDVDVPVFWADFDVAKLWKAVKKRRVKAHDLARFPAVRRDLALVVSKAVAYETLKVRRKKPSANCSKASSCSTSTREGARRRREELRHGIHLAEP